MKYSPLQKARYAYTPKLPEMLRNGIAEIGVKEGAETQSVADQDAIKALFPNTYGKKEITFQKGLGTVHDKAHRLVTLSETIANQLNIPSETAKRCALLCKATLFNIELTNFIYGE